MKTEKKRMRTDMMKSVGHYTNRKHRPTLSMRLVKPQLEKGWHPPEVISKTLSFILCLHTLHFLFIFVWIFLSLTAGSATLSGL